MWALKDYARKQKRLDILNNITDYLGNIVKDKQLLIDEIDVFNIGSDIVFRFEKGLCEYRLNTDYIKGSRIDLYLDYERHSAYYSISIKLHNYILKEYGEHSLYE